MRTFKVDGGRHAVEPEDVLLIEGPAHWEGKVSGRITLREGDTLTMLFQEMQPGEAVTITCDVFPPTIFFRPMGQSRAVESRVKQEA